MIKKGLIIISILILLISNFTGCTENKSSDSSGKIIDGGNTDFSSIQSLIDAASEGDTIIIPSGTYAENLTIRKTIHLKGEDRDTTIIDPNNNVVVILVNNADGTTIKDLTIQNSYEYDENHGIYIHADNCEVSNCIIKDQEDGIKLHWASYNTITNNQFLNNDNGVYVGDISGHGHNVITKNYFSNNGDGVYLSVVVSNQVSENTFEDSTWNGIFVTCSNYNNIYRNNFINNGENAEASKCGLTTVYDCINTWDIGGFGNYWDNYTGVDADGDGIGDTDYMIFGDANNIDRFPLMNPVEI